jgi:hypothetical protein
MDNKTGEKVKKESKISYIEWGLVIGALLTIDIGQIGLEWALGWLAGAGVFMNSIIDIFVGMSLSLYLQLRGQSMVNPKRLFSMIGVFGFEFISPFEEIPMWFLEGIFLMIIANSDKILAQVPGGQVVNSAIDKAEGMSKVVK